MPSHVRKKELSCKKKVVRLMSVESSMGKRNSHIMKGLKMMFPNKIGQELTHYPHVFPNFSIFLFLVKRRRFIVMLCFSLFLYTPKPYQIQRMLRIQVNILCLFFSFGIFVSFFLVSNFDFSL